MRLRIRVDKLDDKGNLLESYGTPVEGRPATEPDVEAAFSDVRNLLDMVRPVQPDDPKP